MRMLENILVLLLPNFQKATPSNQLKVLMLVGCILMQAIGEVLLTV